VTEDGKPIIIVPPYVLGHNILAFLPGENRSYTHCFANQGIPTYVRVVKDIETTPAVQVMSGEDDARDTRYFCEQLKARHGKPVTLNGFCQGGLLTVIDVLSGELDGLVDALITCAAPMDGTRSKSLVGYINQLRFEGASQWQ
jgi:dienelactone hydrolase